MAKSILRISETLSENVFNWDLDQALKNVMTSYPELRYCVKRQLLWNKYYKIENEPSICEDGLLTPFDQQTSDEYSFRLSCKGSSIVLDVDSDRISDEQAQRFLNSIVREYCRIHYAAGFSPVFCC